MSASQNDYLHYEIGALKEDVRNLKHMLDIQNARVDHLVSMLNAIRSAHREAKSFDVADQIRDNLRRLGIPVEDK